MKTSTRKLALTLIALLIAAVMAPEAQLYAAKGGGSKGGKSVGAVRNTTRKNSRPDGTTDGPVANIDENWYLELTPAYVSAGAASIDKFYGASVALGYRITQEDKIQLEIGLYNSNSYSGGITYGSPVSYDDLVAGVTVFDTMTLNGTKSAKATMIPVLLSYSYCIQLDAPGRFEIRLTPVAGIFDMRSTWNVNASGTYQTPDGTIINKTQSLSGSDSNKIAFALGGGFAFTYYFAPRWYVDLGYRYLWTAKVSNPTPANGVPWNGVSAWNGMNTHFYSLTLGWRF